MLLVAVCPFDTVESQANPRVRARQITQRQLRAITCQRFSLHSGETLPELRLHYRTIGTAVKDSSGVTRNAVLIMHGTGGTGTQFLGQQFAGVLFGPGQLLDATRYFIILPDAIGHGGSSKPSEALHAKFPHYTYDDMVAAQYKLITEKLGVNHLRLVMGTRWGMHTR
jgi:homoserine O-acetyltransferase